MLNSLKPIPKPNEIYKHFKGNTYRVVLIAQVVPRHVQYENAKTRLAGRATHTETLGQLQICEIKTKQGKWEPFLRSLDPDDSGKWFVVYRKHYSGPLSWLKNFYPYPYWGRPMHSWNGTGFLRGKEYPRFRKIRD